jgi:hypothetical protein
MKILTETKESEGLEGLMGEQIYIMCACYIYSGKLIGVSNSCVKLEDAKIVYETGDWQQALWEDAQKLHNKIHYVQIGMIESFGLGK